jgi:hypothetical protein
MSIKKDRNISDDLEVDDAEYRLQEFVRILHQADLRALNALLEKTKKKPIKKVKDESRDLPTGQH